MQNVELHAAFMFDCPHCGRENFCRALAPSLRDEDMDAICEEGGIKNDGHWHFILNPVSVICAYCQKESLVENSE